MFDRMCRLLVVWHYDDVRCDTVSPCNALSTSKTRHFTNLEHDHDKDTHTLTEFVRF